MASAPGWEKFATVFNNTKEEEDTSTPMVLGISKIDDGNVPENEDKIFMNYFKITHANDRTIIDLLSELVKINRK